MLACRLALQFCQNGLGEDLTQLDAKLIVGVDPPNRPLDEDFMFIEGDQRTEGPRRHLIHHNRGRRPVARESFVLGKAARLFGVRAALKQRGLGLVLRDPDHQRFRLCQDIG